jgi:hypothetical protein
VTNRQRREQLAAAARQKAAAARAAQQRRAQRRRAFTVIGSVVAVAAVVIVVVIVALNSRSTPQTNDRVNAASSVVHDVSSVSSAELQSVGQGSAKLLAEPTRGDPPLTLHGKPEFLYVGGEFCPYCAAERWSMVQALSRFGTFSHLSEIRSATDDGDLATFSFYGSRYHSKYLAFVPVENVDRNKKQLEPMTPAQQRLFSKYTDGFPFLYFGGKYVQTTAGYNQDDLSGLNQQQIASQLSDPSSKVARDILGEANNLTATLCKITNNQPASACLNPTITNLQSDLGV